MSLGIHLLGSVQICRAEKPLQVRGNKPLALLAYLLLTGKPHSRQHLVDLLFDNAADPRASLRWTLSELRRAIGAEYIVADRQQIGFDFEQEFWLDVAAFEAGQIDLYRGDFLEGLLLRDAFGFEEWAFFERERLRGVYQSALAGQMQAAESRQDYPAVVELGHKLLALDNLNEALYQAVMQAYARQGQREAALAQFDRCHQVLRTELGVEPSTETVALADAIRQGQVETVSVFPDLSLTPNNLPPQTTPFIGRERELAAITRRLNDRTCRLLTLTGPGGIGKTRLALEVGNRLLPKGAFPGGIYFVPLAALSSADFIISAMAETLEVAIQGGEMPKTQLLNFLSELEQDMLLVLDNFEQLADGADILAVVLRRAPAVKLLVTSRERLNLRDEWLLNIEGLPFPQSLQPGEALADYSAVQLFLETAVRLDMTFVMSEVDKPHLVRICQLVEGMPLGLELAAAWVRVLSCQEIAQEVEKSLEFLTTSLRDVPARHRSVLAVFDHSWNRLSPEEERVFCSLAVFRGGFTREAAGQVAAASLPVLASLLDKSMLRRSDSGRYELHELLRQYAAEKLDEAGETDQMRSRHLAYFLELSEQAETKLQGVEQVSWFKRLDSENGNLRAALSWSLESNKTEIGLRLAVTLGQFWWMRGYLNNEGIKWLDSLLSGTDPSEQPAVRARAFRWLGLLRLTAYGGNDATARSAFEQSLALYRALEDWDGIANSLKYLGDIAGFQGDDAALRSFYAAARSAHEEGLIILRAQDDKWRLAWALNALGEIARVEEDYEAARLYYEESVSIRRELGDQRGIAGTISNLGYVAQYQGDVQQAAKFFKEGLVMFRRLAAKRNMISCLADLGGVAGSTNQPVQAARLFGAAEALHEAHGTRMEYADQIEHYRIVTAVREQLDDETFTAAWAEGRTMTLEQAVDYALAIDPDQLDDDAERERNKTAVSDGDFNNVCPKSQLNERWS